MTGASRPGPVGGPESPRCAPASLAAGEELAGTAPEADVWVAVEHPAGWGDARLARSGHGVRVVLARGPRGPAAPPGVRVWVGYASGRPTLRVGHVPSPEVVAGWDLARVGAGSLREWGDPVREPLLLVCANGRRDPCCGHSGGRLAEALWGSEHRDRVLTCTHLGGHRFAPTALLLPLGALHGRLDRESAASLLTEAGQGRMRADTLRGFSTLPAPAQVAEAHVRRVQGHDGSAPLAVELSELDPGHLLAQVHLPHQPGRQRSGQDVVLTERARSTVLGCGRAPERAIRWTLS